VNESGKRQKASLDPDTTKILNPRNTWEDKDERAAKLASEFAAHFDKAYGNKGIDPAVAAQCPGK